MLLCTSISFRLRTCEHAFDTRHPEFHGCLGSAGRPSISLPARYPAFSSLWINPSGTLRFWDGSGGPFVDADGNIWRACILTEDALDQIEMAINAEAFTLPLMVSGIDEDVSNKVWADYQAGTIKGSRFRILIQECDEYDQPTGDMQVKGTFRVDNLVFGDQAGDSGIRSTITIEMTNRFALRTMTSGSVLSDVDQKERSKRINPGSLVDRFCERILLMRDKTIRWPSW